MPAPTIRRNGAVALGLVAAPLAVLLGACAPSSESGTGTGGSGQSTGTGGSAAAGAAGTAGGASGGNSGTGAGGAAATGGVTSGAGGDSTATGTAGGPGGAGGSVSGGGGSSTTGGAGGRGGAGSGSGGTGGGSGGRAGTGGSTSGRGGAGGSVGAAGASGSGATGTGGGAGTVAFQKAAGTIPNSPQPASTVNLPKADWQRGIISPSLQVGKQIAQPSVMNGYLVIGGNEEFWIYDVSNPASPRQLSTFSTPNKTGGEAESHTVSFARYGNTFYMVTIGGRGIDIWDVTNVTAPRHVKQLAIPGTNYGDYTEAVWGVSWQGQYIYVGATNNGIKVVDAANPAAPTHRRKRFPPRQYGGVSAGPLDAIGNVLVVMTPKESGGVATLDISDPTNPVRLASFTTDKAYIGHVLPALRVPDRPQGVGRAHEPEEHRHRHGADRAASPTEGSEYMAFQDDYMFLGHLRTEIGGTPGASKINVANPRSMSVTSRIWGRLNLGDMNDDQFTICRSATCWSSATISRPTTAGSSPFIRPSPTRSRRSSTRSSRTTRRPPSRRSRASASRSRTTSSSRP